jgi:hypothetical protein
MTELKVLDLERLTVYYAELYHLGYMNGSTGDMRNTIDHYYAEPNEVLYKIAPYELGWNDGSNGSSYDLYGLIDLIYTNFKAKDSEAYEIIEKQIDEFTKETSRCEHCGRRD